MKRTLLYGLVLASAAGIASKSEAQGPAAPSPEDSPLVTDRPGNGNAATVVDPGRFQVETSAAYAFASSTPADMHQLSFPTIFRLGVLSGLELRVGTSVIGIDATRGASDVANATDTLVGTKLEAMENDGPCPSLSFMVDITIPTGSGAFDGVVAFPEARAAAAWSLPYGFGLLLNLGADLPEEPNGRFARVLHVVNLGYTLPVFDNGLTLFVESYGRTAFDSGQSTINQVDWGAALLLDTDWQIDFFVQHGLSAAAPDVQASLGLSARF